MLKFSVSTLNVIIATVSILVAAGSTLGISLYFSIDSAHKLATSNVGIMADRARDQMISFLNMPLASALETQFGTNFGDVQKYNILPSEARVNDSAWYFSWERMQSLMIKGSNFRYQFVAFGWSDGFYVGCKTVPEDDKIIQCRIYTREPNTTGSRQLERNFTRATGQLLSSSVIDHTYDPRTRTWYGMVPHTSGALRWSDAYLSAMPTLPIVDINAALFNSSGYFLGVASFSFQLNELDTELKKISPMAGAAVILLDNSKKVLASSLDRDSYEKFEIGINESLTKEQVDKGCVKSDSANSADTSLVVCQYSVEGFMFEPLAELKRKHPNLLSNTSSDSDQSSSQVYKYDLADSSYFVSVISLKMARVQSMHWQVVSFLPESAVTSDIIRGRNIAIYVAVSLGVGIAICVAIVVKLMLRPLSLIASRMESAAYLKVRGGGGKTVPDSSSTEHTSHEEEDNDEKMRKKALAAQEALEKERQPSYLSDVAAIQNAYWVMADELWILKGYIPEHITKGLVRRRAELNGMPAESSPPASDGDLPNPNPRSRGNSKGLIKGKLGAILDRRSSSGRASSGGNKNSRTTPFSPSESPMGKNIAGESVGDQPRKNSRAERSQNGRLSESTAEAPKESVPTLLVIDSSVNANGASTVTNPAGLPPIGKIGSTAGLGVSIGGFEFPTSVSGGTDRDSIGVFHKKVDSLLTDESHLREDSLAMDVSMGSLENVSVAANRLAGLSKVEEEVPIYFSDNVLVDRDITVVHLNIVSFHKYCRVTHGKQLAEEHEAVVNLLYNTAKKCGGVMDTFSGDKFYITFNASSRCVNHPVAALCFAHEVTSILTRDAIWGSRRRKLEQHCRENNKPVPGNDKLPPHVYRAAPFGVSCGVASGRAFVGPLGTEKIRRHSVLSNAMTEAAALERLCMKYPACRVLIAGDFITSIEPYFSYQLLDAAVLPGTMGKRRRLASVKGPMRTSDLTIFKGGCRAMAANARDRNIYSAINDCFLAFLEGRSENCIESLKSVDMYIEEESRRLLDNPESTDNLFNSKTPSNNSNGSHLLSTDIPINREECADMVIMSQFVWSLLQCEPAIDGRMYRSPLGETYQPVQHALFLAAPKSDPLEALLDT